MLRTKVLLAGAATLFAGIAQAQTEITWWHAHGGQLGETVNAIAEKFNAAQSDVVITPVYKGGYEDTLTATIAAFRAGEHPNIVQVFDAGAATIIGARSASSRAATDDCRCLVPSQTDSSVPKNMIVTMRTPA